MYFLNLNFTNADFSMYLVEEVYVTVNQMKVSEKKNSLCVQEIYSISSRTFQICLNKSASNTFYIAFYYAGLNSVKPMHSFVVIT